MKKLLIKEYTIMRSFNRFLLAGTSYLAFIVIGTGVAWAGDTSPKIISNYGYNTNRDPGSLLLPTQALTAATNISIDTNLTAPAGLRAITIAPNLTDDRSGDVNVTVQSGNTVTGGQNSQKAISIGAACQAQPCSGQAVNTTINVNSGASVVGGNGVSSEGNTAGRGIVIEDHISGKTTINNSGTISGGVGGETYAGGAAVDSYSSGTLMINNSGTITGGAKGTTAITLPPRALTFDGSQRFITLNNNDGTINGDIWTSSHGDQLNFYGGTLNGSIQGKGTSNGQMNGSGADVYFRSGSTTVNGDIGKPFQNISEFGNTAYVGPVRSLYLTNGATLKFDQNSDIHAVVFDFVNGGTLDLGTSRVRFYDYEFIDIDETNSGTMHFKTTIDAKSRKHGYWTFKQVGGERDYYGFNHGMTSVIVPTVLGTVQTGSNYIIIQDADGRTLVNTPSVVNGAGYIWTVSNVRCNGGAYNITDGVSCTGQTDTDGISYGSGYTNIIITATNQNAAGSATGVNGTRVQTLATYSGSDPGLQALSQAVNNLTSDADIRKAGAQLRPETTGNTAQASMGAVTQALSTIQGRTDAVRVASSETGTGVSSGETLKGLGVWGQGFGSTASQKERNDVWGYDADTYGLAFGTDFKVIDPLRAGLSFAYAKTAVDSTGVRSGSGQDIDSYITSLYGTYSGKGWYVDGTLTYGIHKYDAKRHVAIPGAPTQTLNADYSGQQYGAKAEVGAPLAVGPAVIIPLASLAYNNLKQDSYRETGDAAALEVSSSSTDSIRSGLGAKVSAKVATIGNWEISPNGRAVWYHEFNQSSPEQTSSYAAGGASFTTPGTDIATEHFNISLGLDVASVRNTTFSARYDADLADKYISHSASLQMRTEF